MLSLVVMVNTVDDAMIWVQWRRVVHFEILLFDQYGIVVEILIVLVHEQPVRLVCIITYELSERWIIIGGLRGYRRNDSRRFFKIQIGDYGEEGGHN